MKPSLLDMLVFLEVVEARSFTAAAKRLGRGKSAVSQTVARLEADLGSRLLYRSTRSLSLTEAGARLYAHCRDLRGTYEAALADLRSETAEPSGTLAVTAPHALCAPAVAPAISRFLDLHPKMRVRLLAEDSQVDLIEARLDLAVRVGMPKEQAARISKLGTLGESLYASPGYVARNGGRPGNLAALADWDHIANDWQGDPVRYPSIEGSQLRVAPRLRCSALPDILRLAERGAGVALLPDLTAEESLAGGALVRLFAISVTPVYAMHHFRTRPPIKVRSFTRLLRAELKRRTAPSGQARAEP